MSDLLHLQVDSSSGVPIYRQLMDQVRYYVASGALRPGDRLPSIRALAKRLHLNPTTITKAYNELQHAGVVVLAQGKGVFVAEGATGVPREVLEVDLRRHAAALSAAARQLDLDVEAVTRVVREEMERVRAMTPRDR